MLAERQLQRLPVSSWLFGSRLKPLDDWDERYPQRSGKKKLTEGWRQALIGQGEDNNGGNSSQQGILGWGSETHR
jgi:hypothetical protein